MDRQTIVYLLVALLLILVVAGYLYLRRQSNQRTSQRRQREENQAHRERLAASRIAENKGQALSSRFATSNASERSTERLI